MSRNYVFVVRRKLPDWEFSIRQPVDYRWVSEKKWIARRCIATHFSSREKADGEILALTAQDPGLIGKLDVVKLTRRKGMVLNV